MQCRSWRKATRVGVYSAVALLCLVWKFVALGSFLLVVVLYTFRVILLLISSFPISRPLDSALKQSLALWGVVVVSTVAPIGVSLRHLPGPPRFVEYRMGLPTKESRELAKRGECILGGCLVWGLEPRWVWVW